MKGVVEFCTVNVQTSFLIYLPMRIAYEVSEKETVYRKSRSTYQLYLFSVCHQQIRYTTEKNSTVAIKFTEPIVSI